MTRSLARKLLVVASFLFVLGPLTALAAVSGHARPAAHNGANFLCVSVDQVNLGICLRSPVAAS